MTLDEAIQKAVNFWWKQAGEKKPPPMWICKLVQHLSEKRKDEAFNFELGSWLPRDVNDLLESRLKNGP